MEQDGATPHTSRQNREFLSGNQVQVLQSPANFPHLWSIENVWQIFKHNVEKKQETWMSCEDMCGNVEGY